jgi:hypothetical protein
VYLIVGLVANHGVFSVNDEERTMCHGAIQKGYGLKRRAGCFV